MQQVIFKFWQSAQKTGFGLGFVTGGLFMGVVALALQLENTLGHAPHGTDTAGGQQALATAHADGFTHRNLV